MIRPVAATKMSPFGASASWRGTGQVAGELEHAEVRIDQECRAVSNAEAGTLLQLSGGGRGLPDAGGQREHKDPGHGQPRDALHEPPPLRIVTPARRLVESACRGRRTIADRGDLAYSRAMRFSFLNGAFLSFVAVPAVGSLVSCSSGGSATGTGGSSVTGSAGTGGSTGSGGDTSTGTGGSGTGTGFPTQACLDKANALLAQMTLDEKIAQTIQVERAKITNAQVTQYGVGLGLQPGRLGAEHQHARGLGRHDRRLPDGVVREPHDPVIYGLDSVHGVGPVDGATVFPHNIGLGATATRRWSRRSRASSPTSRRASAPTSRSRRSSRSRATSAGAAPTRRSARRPELVSAMGVAIMNGLQYPTGGSKISILANAKHYLGDGGTANGVTGGPTPATRRRCARSTSRRTRPRRRARRLDHGLVQQLAGRRRCTATRR